MKYTRFTLMIFGMLLSCFTLAEAAKAEGSRSYIAPSGSDNRACTRSQPCRTFDGALAKTDEGGEIIALETGTYDSTTITKSITLTAAPGADVLIRATSGNAVTINVASDDTVVLRGLKLSGPGQNSNVTGVLLEEASQGMTLIENCVISNFATGVFADISTSARLGINDSVIRNNHTGLTTKFNGAKSMGAFATRTRFEGNAIGVRVLGGTPTVVKECVAAGNGIGYLAEQNGRLVISNSLATRNGVGSETRAGSRTYLASSIFSGNNTGVEVGGGIVRSTGNNMVNENELDVSGTITIIPGT